jgi:7-carboxy-7-deazaguanine synthase
MLTISEIFHSIQGESTYAGLPCTFVRLAACDLRCRWCDTPYAFTGGIPMTVDEVTAAVLRLQAPLVEITGGEPLLQDEVYPLMAGLLARKLTVLLETGGHISVDRIPPDVVRIIDVKCPASGESHRTHWANLDQLTSTDQVKFVIQNHGDYVFARDVLQRYDLAARCASVLFSPVHGVLPSRELAGWILADHVPVRLHLQVHKFIWGAEARGV